MSFKDQKQKKCMRFLFTVHNKMFIDEIPQELKKLKRSEKIIVSEKVIFKKVVIMNDKE